MQIAVSIYQHKKGNAYDWTTLALGPLTLSQSGHSVAKIQRSLIAGLKRLAREVEPTKLAQLRLPRGLILERPRLDLALPQTGGGKRKITGVFPLILEPRWINEETRVWLVYHPARQGEWFALSEHDSLREHAALYFRDVWAKLEDQKIDALKTNGKDRLRVVSLSIEPPSLLDRLPDRKQGIWDDLEPDLFKRKKKKQDGFKVLRQLGADLTQRAADEALPLGTPRPPYRAQLELLLGGGDRRPVIVCGPPQCGKSILLQRWVSDLLHAEGYATHRNLDRVTHVWRIAGRQLIAGMSYLGDWQQRCLDLLSDASRHRLILVVDDIRTFGQLGRTRDSDHNLADFFRGPLARGELVIVGECTAEQLQALEDDAPSFAALFSRVHVLAATPGETLRMMVHEARALELEQRVCFDPLVYQQVLELTDSLFREAAFPGKALDLLRELAHREGPDSGESPEGGESPGSGGSPGGGNKAKRRAPIRSRELIAALAAKTGLPPALLAPDDALGIEQPRRDFERHIMGQPEAIAAASELVVRIRSGLTDPRRPYAVYLLTGPTGTGKTELSKCIAEYLYGDTSRLLRLDMGEHSGPDAAARLVGDRGSPHGLLTERVRQQPFCVLLLDEIEKAHPAVLNLLLQLFDEGRLTDAAGKTADFSHAVVIMTSNLGARARAPVGFADSGEAVKAEVAQAVREFFPPELFNRIDRVIPFAPLDRAAARRIAAKELSSLLTRRGLVERDIFVYPSERVLERVIDEGFDPLYGARTVKRYLERQVGSLLARRIVADGVARMRLFHLYAPASDDTPSAEQDRGGLRLYAETLVDAELGASDLPLEPLLELPVRELAERLPKALDLLDALLDDEALERVAERMRFHLDQHNLGEQGHADALYNLDSLRGQLRQLRGRIGYLHARKRADRRQILDCLAELGFLERALGRIEDPAQHGVWIELTHVGLARRRHRFHVEESGLLEALARAYLEVSGHGELESWALRDAEGKITRGLGESPLPLMAPPEQLVLRISGLGVLDFFGGERGCHIWRSLARGSDVLRVDVWPAQGEMSAADVLAEKLEASLRFRRAIELGVGELPANPQGLLPLVRQYRFDPPGAGQSSPELEVEDFALGYAATQRVPNIGEGLRRLWLLRRSRQEKTASERPADTGATR